MIFISNYLVDLKIYRFFLVRKIFQVSSDIKRNTSNLAKNFYTYLNKSIEKPNQPTSIFDFQTICTYLCIPLHVFPRRNCSKVFSSFFTHKIYERFVDFECHRSILKYEDLSETRFYIYNSTLHGYKI